MTETLEPEPLLTDRLRHRATHSAHRPAVTQVAFPGPESAGVLRTLSRHGLDARARAVRTSSGKVARSACRELFLSGALSGEAL
ncbi:hypothetical protein [Streptomyces fragilis]|uniref:Uncharacterized protein n=1 Tax=Streptomyces fragilis TaxID=67301 RepID=A0ABV2YQF7_9ACTN|nr:hypothetical protein [Streptomyces fragilis]